MCQHQLTRSIFLCSSCCNSDHDPFQSRVWFLPLQKSCGIKLWPSFLVYIRCFTNYFCYYLKPKYTYIGSIFNISDLFSFIRDKCHQHDNHIMRHIIINACFEQYIVMNSMVVFLFVTPHDLHNLYNLLRIYEAWNQWNKLNDPAFFFTSHMSGQRDSYCFIKRASLVLSKLMTITTFKWSCIPHSRDALGVDLASESNYLLCLCVPPSNPPHYCPLYTTQWCRDALKLMFKEVMTVKQPWSGPTR